MISRREDRAFVTSSISNDLTSGKDKPFELMNGGDYISMAIHYPESTMTYLSFTLADWAELISGGRTVCPKVERLAVAE